MKVLSPKNIEGTVTIPASKSQTIRALLIACFSREKSVIRHPLISKDTEAAIGAIKALGSSVNILDDRIEVDATGPFPKESIVIDALNSGTTEYLLSPMVATLHNDVTITGDSQLLSRPISPLVRSLSDLGARVAANGDNPPVRIRGPLKGGRTTIECRTSQYLSGLLLGTAMAEGDSTIECSLLYEKPYVSLTTGWLDRQGIKYEMSNDMMTTHMTGAQRYHGFDEYINGDWSSASFFLCMAVISGCEITVKGLDPNDPQGDRAILDILRQMGAYFRWNGNELVIGRKDSLRGGDFDLNSIPDTLPVLAATAAFAEGDTVLGNVPQARIKETDRISSMRKNLEGLGVKCSEREDALIIHGTGKVSGGCVSGFSDHRIVMAMASMSVATEGNIIIDDESAASVTFPAFFELFDNLKK